MRDENLLLLGALVLFLIGAGLGSGFVNSIHQDAWREAHRPENAWKMYRESKIDEAATNAKAGLK